MKGAFIHLWWMKAPFIVIQAGDGDVETGQRRTAAPQAGWPEDAAGQSG